MKQNVGWKCEWLQNIKQGQKKSSRKVFKNLKQAWSCQDHGRPLELSQKENHFKHKATICALLYFANMIQYRVTMVALFYFTNL